MVWLFFRRIFSLALILILLCSVFYRGSTDRLERDPVKTTFIPISVSIDFYFIGLRSCGLDMTWGISSFTILFFSYSFPTQSEIRMPFYLASSDSLIPEFISSTGP